MDENTRRTVEQIQADIKEILAFDAKKLNEKQASCPWSYPKAVPSLEQVQELLRLVHFRALDFWYTPKSGFAEDVGKVLQFLKGTSDDKEGAPDPNSFKDVLDTFVASFPTQWYQLLALSASFTSAAFEEQRERLMHDARHVMAEREVARQESNFQTEAEKYQVACEQWLKGALASLIVLLFAAITFMFIYPKDSDAYALVQFGITKAIVFASLFFALYFCARNYSANRHNAVVNRHRANALRTYGVLVDAAKKTSDRDIILTKASECIFESLPSGFSKSSGSDSPNINILSIPQKGVE